MEKNNIATPISSVMNLHINPAINNIAYAA